MVLDRVESQIEPRLPSLLNSGVRASCDHCDDGDKNTVLP